MVVYKTGDLFESGASALVNPVNTVDQQPVRAAISRVLSGLAADVTVYTWP